MKLIHPWASLGEVLVKAILLLAIITVGLVLVGIGFGVFPVADFWPTLVLTALVGICLWALAVGVAWYLL